MTTTCRCGDGARSVSVVPRGKRGSEGPGWSALSASVVSAALFSAALAAA
jgi:hypothetical protein